MSIIERKTKSFENGKSTSKTAEKHEQNEEKSKTSAKLSEQITRFK